MTPDPTWTIIDWTMNVPRLLENHNNEKKVDQASSPRGSGSGGGKESPTRPRLCKVNTSVILRIIFYTNVFIVTLDNMSGNTLTIYLYV